MSPKYILATSSYRPIEIFTKKSVVRREQSENEQDGSYEWRGLVTEYGHLLI